MVETNEWIVSNWKMERFVEVIPFVVTLRKIVRDTNQNRRKKLLEITHQLEMKTIHCI